MEWLQTTHSSCASLSTKSSLIVFMCDQNKASRWLAGHILLCVCRKTIASGEIFSSIVISSKVAKFKTNTKNYISLKFLLYTVISYFPNRYDTLAWRSNGTSPWPTHLSPHDMPSVGPPPCHQFLLRADTSSFHPRRQTTANRCRPHRHLVAHSEAALCKSHQSNNNKIIMKKFLFVKSKL